MGNTEYNIYIIEYLSPERCDFGRKRALVFTKNCEEAWAKVEALTHGNWVATYEIKNNDPGDVFFF